MNYLEEINRLITYLPEKDREIALKLVNNRSFEELEDLVLSCISRVKKSIHSGSPREEYLKVDIDSLTSLIAIIRSYLIFQ